MARKQSVTLASARAYYRLAAKADRNGQPKLAEHYRKIADRKVREDRSRRDATTRAARKRALCAVL